MVLLFTDIILIVLYLKVDFGLAGSIRISDHVGKGYLNYTFNVGTDIKEYREEQGKNGVRYFIPESRLELLLPLVNKIYKSKITKYGKHWYNNKKEECEKKNIRELGKGFWSGAYRVWISILSLYDMWYNSISNYKGGILWVLLW